MFRILKEMAKDLAGIRKDIESKEEQIRIHLLMIYVYPNGNIKHWEDEIFDFLHEIPRLKRKSSNNGLIDKKQFLRFSWYIYEDVLIERFQTYIKNIEYKENKKITLKNPNPEVYYNFVKDYYFWLADKLTTIGEVTEKEVVDKIEELRKNF